MKLQLYNLMYIVLGLFNILYIYVQQNDDQGFVVRLMIFFGVEVIDFFIFF